MKTKSKLAIGTSLAVTVAALGLGQSYVKQSVSAQNNMDMVSVPDFQVDPFWPKPLPNQWIMGNVIGVDIDERDHVYIVHRDGASNFGGATEIGLAEGVSDCCAPAPPIIEFDPEGNMVNAWGGEDGEHFTWPASNHGIGIAPNGNVWIGGNGGGDSHLLELTGDGHFVAQHGTPGQGADSNSTDSFGQPADVEINQATNEVYVGDGYGNKRVAVLDLNTGEFKRYWGAYGEQPEDIDVGYTPGEPLPQQFVGPVHCAVPSDDGLLYVCDRGADRIQVFRPDGTFVREQQIEADTLGAGSTWDISFSSDAEQEFLYLADGQNGRVHILDRESLELLTSFGDGGRQPGQFYGTHSIATDSRGNIYTTETYEGKRIQKFVYQGMKQVERGSYQGEPWPEERR